MVHSVRIDLVAQVFNSLQRCDVQARVASDVADVPLMSLSIETLLGEHMLQLACGIAEAGMVSATE